MITATLHVWPASDVPAPREVIGAPCLRQSATVRMTSSMRARQHDADRDVAIVGCVGGPGGAAAGVEADFAGGLRGEIARQRARVPGLGGA